MRLILSLCLFSIVYVQPQRPRKPMVIPDTNPPAAGPDEQSGKNFSALTMEQIKAMMGGNRGKKDKNKTKVHDGVFMPYRTTLKHRCDYLAYYCLRAFQTGMVCARTIYYKYKNFKNACMMDFVNCKMTYEAWQLVHMGQCWEIEPIKDKIVYNDETDTWLDGYVVRDVKEDGVAAALSS